MNGKKFSSVLRYVVPAVVLVVSLALLVPIATTTADTEVNFPDANLEAAIREAINKPEPDPIYDTDLVGLTAFSAASENIVDLSGLEYCINLTTLNLDGNLISDMAPVSGLSNLTSLSFSNNQVSEISALAGLTNLTALWFENNLTDNLTPLSGLVNLTELGANNDGIHDISALAGLTNLTVLHLHGNHIDSLSPLSNLTDLRILGLNDNGAVGSLSPLSYLTKMQRLGLDSDNISDITALSGLSELTYLRASNNKIDDISVVAGFTKLENLLLANNEISDLTPLSGITSLLGVYLNGNEVVSLAALSGLTSLTDVEVGYNLVRDAQPLVSNPGVGSGDKVVLNSDPLNAHTVNTCIPALMGRGVTVYWDGAPAGDENPDQPTNELPLSGAIEVSLTPTLQSSIFSDNDTLDTHSASQWQVTTTAGDYSSPAFDSDTDSLHLENTTVPLLAYSTTYYWRVAHQDNHGAWSLWSAETSFTTINRPPNQPTNASPTGAAIEVSLTPTMESSAFSDPDAGNTHAASEWQVTATPGDYSSPVFESLADSVNLTSIQVPADKLGYSTVYYWHVQHQDNRGAWSGWSAETSFTTISRSPDQPTNNSPANAAKNVSLTPTLQSSAFNDPDAGDTHAASEWQVTTTAGEYSNPVFDSGTDGVNLVSILVPSGELGYSTTYYWHVRHQDNRGRWSDWSLETSFTTINHPPNQPGNVSPANGATGQSVTPTLTSTVFSDTDTGDTHAASQWQVTATPGDYSSPAFDSGTDSVNLVSILVPSGKLLHSNAYYWHVRYQDNHGDWSDWSPETSFLASNRPPNQPSNVSPAGGASGQSLTPTLTCWAFSDSDAEDTHTASQWQVTRTAGDYSSPVYDSLADTAKLVSIAVPSGKLGYSITYYWHVRHQDNHGDWSQWSAETSFVTGNETTPPVISDVTETEISATGATITWTTDEGATSQVEYGLDSSYGSSTTLDSNLVTSHTVNLAGLKHGKTYYYRVISRDAANNEAISGGGSFATSTRSGGMPAWLWVVIGVVAVAAVGAVALLVRRRSRGR